GGARPYPGARVPPSAKPGAGAPPGIGARADRPIAPGSSARPGCGTLPPRHALGRERAFRPALPSLRPDAPPSAPGLFCRLLRLRFSLRCTEQSGERMAEFIRIVGARENNLKNVSLTIPKRKITVFTGVSGSGKSSIVFDTIAAEAQRQLNETFTAFARTFLPSYGHPDVDTIENISAAIVVDQKRIAGNSRSTVGTITDIAPLLRLLFSRAGEPHVGHANAFSFNDPQGMCPRCDGIGRITTLDLDAFLDRSKSL